MDLDSKDINILAITKGRERYIFIYDNKNRDETLRVLDEYVSNPDLSFNEHDRAVLSERICEEAEKGKGDEKTKYLNCDRFSDFDKFY